MSDGDEKSVDSESTTAAAPEPSGAADPATSGGRAEAEADRTAAAVGEGQGAEAAAGPVMVRRVVVSYQLGWLPGDWLQTWRRLDRTFVRANLKVKATLAPLEDLPEDMDILVVPPELREAAREAAKPGTPILVTPAGAAAGAFAELLTRLEAGTAFTAEKFTDAEKEGPRIISYRGHTLLD